MNLDTFERLIFLLNQVPDIADLYEKRNSTFCDSVKEWMGSVEKILKKNRIQLVAEISTLKAMITSAQRGVENKGILMSVKPGHSLKRKRVDATSLHVLHETQHSLQILLDPFEKKYEEAKQLARKILVMASVQGILNARLGKKFDPATTLPFLWKDLVSNETISPWTGRILEIVTFGEALKIMSNVLDEWINDHQKNLVQQR